MIRTLRMICVGACLGFAAMLVFVALPGCNKNKTEVAKTPKTTTPHAEHEDGPHGGALAEWGEKHEYHAEFIVDAAKKQVTVYVLGKEPDEEVKIDAKTITDVKLTILDSKPLVQLDLKHDPKESGAKGIAFTATHDSFAKPEGMKVEISGKIDGAPPYVGTVTYKAPKKSASILYLTPGGIYTAADIKANGGKTAKEKYGNRDWAHDDNLKKGDRICPVTKNKADPECVWTVQGQNYQFCCHPCVDKFVRQAHDETAAKNIKNANEYVFKGS